jgi:hypothetical protein
MPTGDAGRLCGSLVTTERERPPRSRYSCLRTWSARAARHGHRRSTRGRRCRASRWHSFATQAQTLGRPSRGIQVLVCLTQPVSRIGN